MKSIAFTIFLFLGIQVCLLGQELTTPVQTSCISNTIIQSKLKITPEDNAGSIIVIPKLEEIVLTEYVGKSNWKVSYKGKVGFLNELFIKQTSKMVSIKKDYYRNKAEYENNAEDSFNSIRTEELNKKFGSYYASCIMEGKVSFGMSKEMVKAAKGKPDKIKTGEGDWCIVELWIYTKEDLYVYFENDKVSTFNK